VATDISPIANSPSPLQPLTTGLCSPGLPVPTGQTPTADTKIAWHITRLSFQTA